jgi:class I fructose-bisphosphate aldolase
MPSAAEQGIDVVSYGAHMAALLGAHIIKVKLPTSHIACQDTKEKFAEGAISVKSLAERVNFIMKACFNKRRIVVFTGGITKSEAEVLEEIQAVKDGGGHGSIMGRNCFQRPNEEAKALVEKIIDVYKN